MVAKDDAKPSAKKGSNLIKILLIVIGAVVLIGGSVGATLVLTGALQKKPEEAASVAAPAAGHGAASHPAAATASSNKLPPLYQPIEPPFIVNFEDQGVLRYLQIGLSVMTRDKLVVDAITTHMPQIRNDLILLFADQKMETLGNNAGKEKLRVQAMEKVQAVLSKEIGSPGIEDIYFTAFVLQ